MDPIFVNEPKITPKMVDYVSNAVKSTWISSAGEYLDKFEVEFARYIGTKYATTCSNGTVSLQLALSALGVGRGHEVIMPDQTIASCAFAPLYLGAKPVFVDIKRDTFCIDVDLIEKAITKKTKVIMPVHLFGQSCDMDFILRLAKKYNLQVLEDSAEAIGAEYRGKKCGSMGNIGSFSFYANKLVTSGEGGIVTTNDKALREKMKSLKNLSHAKDKRFWHESIGYNFRMTNYQCALALASLEDVEESLRFKQEMAFWYTEGLKSIGGLTLPITARYNNVHSYWMYTVVVEDNFGISRDLLMERLWQEYKIQTRTFFYSLSDQPILKNSRLVKGNRCPVSKELSRKGFYLPSGLALTRNQVERVIKAIKSIKFSL